MTRARAREKKGEEEGRVGPEQRAPTPPPPPSQLEWPTAGGEDAPITRGMLPAITASIVGELTKLLGIRAGPPTPLVTGQGRGGETGQRDRRGPSKTAPREDVGAGEEAPK